MKHTIVFLLLFVIILSCQKEKEQIPKLHSDFSYVEENGLCKIINKSTTDAKNFTIMFGDGEDLTGRFDSDTLAVHQYKKEGSYQITLLVWGDLASVAVSSKQVISIQSLKLPIADFKYEILENGGVKITNTSKYGSKFNWNGNTKSIGNGWYETNQQSPTFMYETNGKYYISLRAKNNLGESTKRDSIEIKNVTNPSMGEFTGTFFDKTGIFKGEQINTFNYSWGILALSGFSCYKFEKEGLGSIFIIINGDSRNWLDKYTSLKDKFQVKAIDLKNWGQIFLNNKAFWYSGEPNFNLSESSNSEVSILKVEEVNQPKLFPELYDKAFWVTFKIKADFGEKGKIDGILKTRYLIY